MKVALYARVSTKDQDAGMQLDDLRQMAKARGLEIAEEYVDTIGGAKDSRPELNRMMNGAKQGQFKAVLVWKLDRFGRSLRHLVTALDELNGYGVGFVSYTDPIDTTTPTGRMLFGIMASFAEFERELIRERTKAGLARAKRNGKTLGRPKAVIDLPRARKLQAEGWSIRAISRKLGASRDVLTARLKQ